MNQEQQQHQHFPYGKIFQTEHFNLMVKRCRLCGEFIGVETAERKDIQPIVEKEIE